jgi:hypothetical protein
LLLNIFPGPTHRLQNANLPGAFDKIRKHGLDDEKNGSSQGNIDAKSENWSDIFETPPLPRNESELP